MTNANEMTNADEITVWIVRTTGKRHAYEFKMHGTRAEAIQQAKTLAETRPDLAVTVFRAEA
jgi:hypothetical protein